MAGWSMIVDGSALDCAKTPPQTKLTKLEPNQFWFDLKLLSSETDDKVRCWFNQFLRAFIKEICAQDSFWPIPPMLGEGQPVDLLKLFLNVRERGGYDVVSKNELWDVVAKESELGSHLASAVKLVYIKYLDSLERWLERVVEDKGSKSKLSNGCLKMGGVLMELGAQFKGFLGEIPNGNEKDTEYPCLELSQELNFEDVGNDNEGAKGECNDGDKCAFNEECKDIELGNSDIIDFLDVGKLRKEDEEKGMEVDLDVEVAGNLLLNKVILSSSDVAVIEISSDDDMKSSMIDLEEGKKGGGGDNDDVMMLDLAADKKDISCRKRKRDSMLGMLSWVTRIAKDPCHPVVGSLPGRSKWKSYGDAEPWKQVLLVREALFSKRHVNSSAEQSSLKNQKIHPCMYDNDTEPVYKLRERLTCCKKLSVKMSSPTKSSSRSLSFTSDKNDSDTDPSKENPKSSVFDYTCPNPIPIGPDFQAEVPEWTGVASESESKWLGTRVWPLEKPEHRFLIERDPIGKGRQNSCGCQVPDSVECVRFHIAERRLKVKLELGNSFQKWGFDKMGEVVTICWTEEEQKKFKAIIRSNAKSFWDLIFKAFPSKSREDLVSYYFNVYLLQRRAYENRFTPNNIHSDDEGSESGPIANGFGRQLIKLPSSSLQTPKKLFKRSK